MSNTLTNTYRVNFNKLENEFVEDANGSMPVKEYTNAAGVTMRVITVGNVNDLQNNIYRSMILHQVYDGEKWMTTDKGKTAVGSSETYVNTSTGEPVERSEALEIVDGPEILDYSDPENPVSFDPQQFDQVEAIKSGYAVESSIIIATYAPTLFPFFEGVMIRNYEIQTP